MKERCHIIADFDGLSVDSVGLMNQVFAMAGLDFSPQEFIEAKGKLRYLARKPGQTAKSPLASYRQRKWINAAYMDELELYPAMAQMYQAINENPRANFTIVTRNISKDARASIKAVFDRAGVDIESEQIITGSPFFSKLRPIKRLLRSLDLNRTKVLALDDEGSVYDDFIRSAQVDEIRMASYGHDSAQKLAKLGVPQEITLATAEEMRESVLALIDEANA